MSGQGRRIARRPNGEWADAGAGASARSGWHASSPTTLDSPQNADERAATASVETYR
jgi:hypothetical protein